MGLIGIVSKVVGVIILAVIGVAAFLYFTDYEASATITEKGKDAQGDFVVIKPDLVPRSFTYHLSSNAAQFICKDYEVTYRIQSGHYKVFDTQGREVYDSDAGLTDAFAPVRCSLLGS